MGPTTIEEQIIAGGLLPADLILTPQMARFYTLAAIKRQLYLYVQQGRQVRRIEVSRPVEEGLRAGGSGLFNPARNPTDTLIGLVGSTGIEVSRMPSPDYESRRYLVAVTVAEWRREVPRWQDV